MLLLQSQIETSPKLYVLIQSLCNNGNVPAISPYDHVKLRDEDDDSGDDDDLVLSQFVCVGAGGQESPLES